MVTAAQHDFGGNSAIAGLECTAGDADAILTGYTRQVNIEGGCQGGEFLVKPDEDLDGRFRAWGADWQEWTWVNGSNCLIEGIN